MPRHPERQPHGRDRGGRGLTASTAAGRGTAVSERDGARRAAAWSAGSASTTQGVRVDNKKYRLTERVSSENRDRNNDQMQRVK